MRRAQTMPVAGSARRDKSAQGTLPSCPVSDYRTAPGPCPACGARLEERLEGDVVVDVCGACAGLWIDWFDGEAHDVARKVGGLPVGRGGAVRGSAPCPRCHRPLFAAMHGAASVLRCGECAGTFVPRVSFEALAAMESLDAPPEEDPDLWARIAAAIRALLA